ncbi:MAG TPA: peptidylprolyl isomerase [Bacteroidota bacterium]|nr:peptidylprolyl isomerase [Bacteroidota bacterium]
MKIVDQRINNDQTLRLMLSDSDAVVRERAASAYGSLQDTTALPLLLKCLTMDPDSGVSVAAAFAIGETGGFLCDSSKDKLTHEILSVRIDAIKDSHASARRRIIEEIGKFGSANALKDLMMKFSNGPTSEDLRPFLMSIARFAIRGVFKDDADMQLVTIVSRAETAPWQAFYAMQRIGKQPILQKEAKSLVSAVRNPDPLARMNFATFLGKNGDRTLAEQPLEHLASSDPDWRVRVNALKAMGVLDYGTDSSAIRVFIDATDDSNAYVAITALSTIGTMSVHPDGGRLQTLLFHRLQTVSSNADRRKPWQLQAEAANSLAKLTGKEALAFVDSGSIDNKLLEGRLIEALGYAGDPAKLQTILKYVSIGDPILTSAGLNALLELNKRNRADSELRDKSYQAAIDAMKSSDMAIATTAASVLGDSLFLRTESVDPLLASLRSRKLPDDVEAIQEIIATLGKIGSKDAIPDLKKELSATDRSIALAAQASLKRITGEVFPIASKFTPQYSDYDLAYLSSLPSTVRVTVKTSKGDIHIELFPDQAPFTVMSCLKLADRGFYRGTIFHRVVPNFVIQGGDPRGDGWGGPGYALRSEFSSLTYDEGVVGIASAGKDTEGSQFFITQSPQPHLDGRYTIIGRVVSGMEVSDKILVGDRIIDVVVNH